MDRIFSDVDTGAIPPLRQWKGIELIMDETMKVDGLIMIQGGTHQDTIRLTFSDWFGMVRPRVWNVHRASSGGFQPGVRRP